MLHATSAPPRPDYLVTSAILLLGSSACSPLPDVSMPERIHDLLMDILLGALGRGELSESFLFGDPEQVSVTLMREAPFRRFFQPSDRDAHQILQEILRARRWEGWSPLPTAKVALQGVAVSFSTAQVKPGTLHAATVTRTAPALRIFAVVEAFVPARIAREEVGDALEYISQPDCPRWRFWTKVVTTLLWVLVNAFRELTSALLGRKSSAGS